MSSLLKLEMNLDENSVGGIGDAEFKDNVNNDIKLNYLSKKSVAEIQTKNDGYNCIVMGNYVGTKHGKLINDRIGYQGFIWGLTNSIGELETSLKLVSNTPQGQIGSITIMFDKNANQFATEYYINKKKYINDDNELTILFNEPKYEQEIKFTKWNRAGYSACITFIGITLNSVIIDGVNVNDFELLNQSKPYQPEPFFGYVSSKGSFNFVDKSGEFIDYANDGILKRKNTVDIYINNVLYDKKQVEEWTEPNQSKLIISGDIADSEIIDILNKKAPALYYKYDGKNPIYISDIVKDLCFQCGFTFNELYLNNISFSNNRYKKDIALESGSTYKEIFDKISNILQTYYTIDVVTKEFKTINALPHLSGKIINITPNAQNNDFEQIIMIKNKYKGLIADIADTKITQSSETGIQKTTTTPIYYNYTRYSDYFGDTRYIVEFQCLQTQYKFTLENYKKYIEFNSRNECVMVSSLGGYQSIGKLNRIINKHLESPKDEFLNSFFRENIINKVDINRITYGFSSFYLINTGLSAYKINEIKNSEIIIDFIICNKIQISVESYDDIDNTLTTYSIIKNFDTENPDYPELYPDPDTNINMELNYSSQETSTEQVKYGIEPYYEITNNEFLQTKSLVEDLYQNIKRDYSNSVRQAKLTVSCGVDFYDTKGNLAIDWSRKNKDSTLPNTLKVGDVVNILSNKKDSNGNYISKSTYNDGTPRYWKITGIKVNYKYIPTFELELMEVFN